MEIKKFIEKIDYYKKKDISKLKNLDVAEKSIGDFHWDICSEIITEQRVMNMDVGSYYIKGTIDIFIKILNGAEDKSLVLSNKKLSLDLLSENSEKFKVFLDLLEKKTVLSKYSGDNKKTLTETLLDWDMSSKARFWDGFHFKMIDDLISVGEDILNYINNINHVLYLESESFKKTISMYVEYSNFDFTNNFMKDVLDYTYCYDKYIIPTIKLEKHGRDEVCVEKIKEVSVLIKKLELEASLTEKIKSKDKIKNKI